MPEHSEFTSLDWRPEVQLLLSCAHAQMHPANAERIVGLLQNDIDWDFLLQMAFRHNVVSLLYRSLKTVGSITIPETVQAELKAQIEMDVQGNLFLTKELLELLALFEQGGIPVVPYKGPVLAASIYGDQALRPYSDLDILVHERDILQAMDLLAVRGYEIIRPRSIAQTGKAHRSLGIEQLIGKSAWAYQMVLWHPDRQVILEVHWRITPRYIFPHSPEQLWEDLKPVTLGGVRVPSFSPENLLWFLCIHGAKHQWKRLSWLCDIAELVYIYPQLNWGRLMVQATELGMERRLCLGLILANCLLEMPLPETIKTKIHTVPHVKALARRVMERAFDGAEQASRFPYLEQFEFQLRAIDRVADRARYLLRFANGIDVAARRAFLKPLSFLS
jgi:hypothetical protein